jgi:hypothetical protein
MCGNGLVGSRLRYIGISMRAENLDLKTSFIEKETGLNWVKESNEVLKMIKGLQMNIRKRCENG